ncbi:tyrosine-protein phosphatase DSP3-like [Mercurialis annua]|uniref:tyrosine-protein phosphatase DSP3-like n=1 Tax=Mercurialis annua TaxID=3986 RepID=UPI00215E7CED|nr:tyrosine-protein phosphatase DSP3-like [Mercurialis annua]
MGLILQESEERNNDDVLLEPPPNFSAVEAGVIFRSSFPQPSNFSFLQSLNLRSVIYLCSEPYPQHNTEFLNAHNIQLFQFGIAGKTASTSSINDAVTEALKILLDPTNHPVLIHCNQGKHRTGTVVGCFRKLQDWRLDSVLDEYKYFAGAKSRDGDLKFIERFDGMKCLYSIMLQCRGSGSNRSRLICGEDDVLKNSLIRSS